MTAKREMVKREMVIQVRRDYDGTIYSMVVNLAHKDRLKNRGPTAGAVVIDRQRGRQFDQETVLFRAQSFSELTGYPYDEDLTWPCNAERGFIRCTCPKCAAKADARAKKR